MIEKAYAKINLGLRVVGRRSDGYHDLQMLMVPIDLHDTLWIEEAPHPNIIINEHLGSIEDNLIYKMYFDIKKRFNVTKDASIFVDKVIPVGAGLGGGSSDAAATLRGLDQLWGLHLSKDEMMEIAASHGSDIPFFIASTPAYVSGRGDYVQELDFKATLHLVCIFPSYSLSTKDVFALHPTSSPEAKIHELITVYQTGNVNDIGSKLFNDLIVPASMIATSNHHQSPLWYQEMLLSHEAVAASMSGSGSTVFGLYEDQAAAERICKQLQVEYPNLKIWTTSTLS